MRVQSRSSSLVAGVLAAGLLLSACSGDTTMSLHGDAAPGLEGFSTGDVAARAGEAEVTVEQLRTVVEPFVALRTAGMPEADALVATVEAQRQVLQFLLTTAVFEERAQQDFGFELSDADVTTALQRTIDSTGGEEAFAEALAAQGVTIEIALASERANLVQQAVAQALIADAPITDDEVAAAVEAQGSTSDQVSARHILVQTEAEALAALARLDAGEEFAALAAELSLDGSGAQGGSLGLNPRGTYVEPFEAAIWDGPATIGEVIGPVETQFGFHLILVDEFVVADPAEAAAAARASLEQGRAQDMMMAWQSQALSDANPSVAGRFGSWNRQSQSIDPIGGAPEPEL